MKLIKMIAKKNVKKKLLTRGKNKFLLRLFKRRVLKTCNLKNFLSKGHEILVLPRLTRNTRK